MTDGAGFIETRADEALSEGIAGVRARPAFLMAIIRKAADMLAETDGHDATSRHLAVHARIHAERAARQGAVRGRGR